MIKKWEKIAINIYKNVEEEKKYRVDLYYGRNSSGKIVKTSKVLYGTLKDAKRLLKLHEAERIKNNLTMPKTITMKELINDWNKNINEVRNMETTQVFNHNIQKHIIEYLGDIRISNITSKLILDYFTYLKNEKMFSNGTINKHRTHLYTLFEFMVYNEEYYGVSKNVVQKTRALSVAERHYDIFEPEVAKELLMSLRESGRIDLEVAVNLALYCGCRREETCALKWNCVDLDKRTIRIQEVRTTAGKQIIESKYTKNKKIRIIGIPDWLAMVLQIAQNVQAENRLIYGNDYYQGEEYVFCHPDGTPWHPNSLSREYKKYLERNNFKVIRYHDLRHTNLSLLLTKMSAVDVAKLGGHRQVSITTDIYGHSFNDTVERGRMIMNNLITMNCEPKPNQISP